MTSHGTLMMTGVIITQLQSSLREQLIYYQLSDMSSPAKDEMESSHWFGDLIEVNTEAYTISRLPGPNKIGCIRATSIAIFYQRFFTSIIHLQ